MISTSFSKPQGVQIYSRPNPVQPRFGDDKSVSGNKTPEFREPLSARLLMTGAMLSMFAMMAGMFGKSITITSDPVGFTGLYARDFAKGLENVNPAQLNEVEREALRSTLLRELIGMQRTITVFNSRQVVMQQLRERLNVAIPTFTPQQVEGLDRLIEKAAEVLRSGSPEDQMNAARAFVETSQGWLDIVGREKYGLPAETVAYMKNELQRYADELPQYMADSQRSKENWKLLFLASIFSMLACGCGSLALTVRANRQFMKELLPFKK